MSTSEYTSQYIDGSDGFDGIPVMGHDEWVEAEKREKVERAENKLERDVNDGAVIEDPTEDHADAVEEWASYLLAGGVVDPNSAKGGDLSDDGSRRAAYAGQFKSMYNETIESILASDDDPTNDINDYNPEFEFGAF